MLKIVAEQYEMDINRLSKNSKAHCYTVNVYV